MAKSIAVDTASAQESEQTRWGKVQSQSCDRIMGIATCVIGSSSHATIKTTNTIYPIINGALVAGVTTAETALAASTVTNGNYNVWALICNSSGTLSTLAGTQASTLAGVAFPTITANCAVVGFVTVHPTGTGSFVGGTTNLDDGTVTPNAVFFDALGFNPNMLSL